ncbi:MAG: alpha/beta hydrolase [Candidatus Moduliflexus flocculans]|nr:alpha/beta hydrolase [Candidatus Moduliflexus flocculans]
MKLLAEDVRALLAHLRIERVAVAGLSMGGYLAFEVCRQAPGLFRGLALCDTKAGADTRRGRGRARGLREERPRARARLGGRPDDAEAPQAAARPGRGRRRCATSSATARRPAWRPPSAAWRGAPTPPPRSPPSRCPTLVVVGEEDGLTPPAESEKLAAAVKGAPAGADPRRRPPPLPREPGRLHGRPGGLRGGAPGVTAPSAWRW